MSNRSISKSSTYANTDLLSELEVEEERGPTSVGLPLSDIFKFISSYRHRGHQIGRKVGDMLEVLTLAALRFDPELSRRLIIEPYIEGASTAKHKVEFAIYDGPKSELVVLPDEGNETSVTSESGKRTQKKSLGKSHIISAQQKQRLKAFIECKKVGVEQTVNSAFKKRFYSHSRESERQVPFNDPFCVKFQHYDFEFRFLSDGQGFSIRMFLQDLKESNARLVVEEAIEPGSRFMVGSTVGGVPFLLGNSEDLSGVSGAIRRCRILEVKSITSKGVTCVLNDCLPGPQTPEKAKQASFVALDVRKLRFGTFDKRQKESECVSILVLTEFAHWEEKSQKMIQMSIDYNLVVDDSLVEEAIRKYEEVLGSSMWDKISKENFENCNQIAEIAKSIVLRNEGKIFRDICDNTLKKIFWDKNKVNVSR